VLLQSRRGVRRRPSSRPPHRRFRPATESPTRACTADRPISTRLEPARSIKELSHWFTGVTPSGLACRAQAVWQYQPVSSLSWLLPPSPAIPGSGCHQLQQGCCDNPTVRALHSNPVKWRLVAHETVDIDDQPAAACQGAFPELVETGPVRDRLTVLSCELVLFLGRPCGWPDCAASANPFVSFRPAVPHRLLEGGARL
jgi:hypothetical protein